MGELGLAWGGGGGFVDSSLGRPMGELGLAWGGDLPYFCFYSRDLTRDLFRYVRILLRSLRDPCLFSFVLHVFSCLFCRS